MITRLIGPFYGTLLPIYKLSLKKIGVMHHILYGVMRKIVIPILEKVAGFYANPSDPIWVRMELLTGRHELEDVRVVRQRAKPGMIVLDVGAHAGYYTRCYLRQSLCTADSLASDSAVEGVA